MGIFRVEPYLDTWGISKYGLPLFEVNRFLMSYEKPKTAKKYAHTLVKYLTYLDEVLNITYLKARERHLRAFIGELMYGSKVVFMGCKITKATEQNYKSILRVFYQHLMGELGLDQEILSSSRIALKESFYYGQIYSYLIKSDGVNNPNSIVKASRKNYKFKAKRTYRKWYTEEEIEALASNFRTLRDKMIFLISVELGCRCEEILTIKYANYNWDQVIYISQSKTFNRHLAMDKGLDASIKQYILTDRAEIESEVGVCEYLFLNKKGQYKGSRVQYHNFREILKGCARRAGLSEEKVITHAGRSTRAASLFKMQRQGVLGVTDEFILQTMGWSSIESAKPYRKMLDIDEKKAIIEKLRLRRRSRV